MLTSDIKTYRDFLQCKRQAAKKYGGSVIRNMYLIEALKNMSEEELSSFNNKTIIELKQWLVVRKTRTLSGVTPITVLTKPYPCPGKCVYCPLEPGMPKSYLSNEPAAQRAKLLAFDPTRQTKRRIEALEINGHTVDKIELLVLGGSWSAYKKDYQEDFIKQCFDVCNNEVSNNLEEAQIKNETAQYRIIGITLETRPDLIDKKEVVWLRYLGCTRIQMGVQHTDKDILEFVERGHTPEQVQIATALLKQSGFKVDYHLMPDLPGSTPKKDLKMFDELFSSENYQPDQIKIYPTIVNEYAPLYQWFKEGKYVPYSEEVLLQLLKEVKLKVPYYVRINRLIRDIPKESIIAGNNITNLRQYLQKELKEEGKKCKCMRCRETRDEVSDISDAHMFIEEYRAHDGVEYFISFENKDRTKLYSFIRFRINDNDNHFMPELSCATLVRELHTYGRLLSVADSQEGHVQHKGFGKRLMEYVEEMTKQKGKKRIAVISGIGVRPYYKKIGYHLEGTYMVKEI